MIYFILGIILGVLVRDIKCKGIEIIQGLETKEFKNEKGKVQFLGPITYEEKFNSANNISDVL
jgi:hypothetical protein